MIESETRQLKASVTKSHWAYYFLKKVLYSNKKILLEVIIINNFLNWMQVHDIFYTLWSLTQMSPNLNFYFIAQCLANVKIQIKWFIRDKSIDAVLFSVRLVLAKISVICR